MALKGYNLTGLDLPVFPADPVEQSVNGRIYYNSTSNKARIYQNGAWADLDTNSGGTGTVTNVATGTGLTGGPITTTGTVSLANTAVTPGSYTSANITVDAQGRLTSAASGSSGANTTLSNLTSPTAITQDLIFNKSSAKLQTKNNTTQTQDLTIQSGNASADASGNVTIGSGTGTSTTGFVIVASGAMSGTNDSAVTGPIDIHTGYNNQVAADGATGNLNLSTGNVTDAAATIGSVTGTIYINTGNHTGLGSTGPLSLKTGNSDNSMSGDITVQTGNTSDLTLSGTVSGNLTLGTGTGTTATSGGGSGNLILNTGDGDGQTGTLSLTTGNITGTSGGLSGNLSIGTGHGDGNSGDLTLFTGDSAAATGNIFITTDTGWTTEQGYMSINTAFLLMPKFAADPVHTGLVSGAVYYNTGTNKLKLYNGTTWETVTSA